MSFKFSDISKGNELLIPEIDSIQNEFIPLLSQKKKEPYLKLLPLVFFNTIQDLLNQINKKNSIYYQFFLPILSIFQSIAKYLNNIIFPQFQILMLKLSKK